MSPIHLTRGAKNLVRNVKFTMKETYYHMSRQKGVSPYSCGVQEVSEISSMRPTNARFVLPSFEFSQTELGAHIEEITKATAISSENSQLPTLPAPSESARYLSYSVEDLLGAEEYFFDELALIQPLKPLSASVTSLRDYILRTDGYNLEDQIQIQEVAQLSAAHEPVSPVVDYLRRAREFDEAYRLWNSPLARTSLTATVNGISHVFRVRESIRFVPRPGDFDVEEEFRRLAASDTESPPPSPLSDESFNHEWQPIAPIANPNRDDIEAEIEHHLRKNPMPQLGHRLSNITEANSIQELPEVSNENPSISAT